MANFEDIRGSEKNTERPFFTKIDDIVENSGEDFDGCFHQAEEKRRLLPDQVQFLEKSFEVEYKLEPEPRTVAAVAVVFFSGEDTAWEEVSKK